MFDNIFRRIYSSPFFEYCIKIKLHTEHVIYNAIQSWNHFIQSYKLTCSTLRYLDINVIISRFYREYYIIKICNDSEDISIQKFGYSTKNDAYLKEADYVLVYEESNIRMLDKKDIEHNILNTLDSQSPKSFWYSNNIIHNIHLSQLLCEIPIHRCSSNKFPFLMMMFYFDKDNNVEILSDVYSKIQKYMVKDNYITNTAMRIIMFNEYNVDIMKYTNHEFKIIDRSTNMDVIRNFDIKC